LNLGLKLLAKTLDGILIGSPSMDLVKSTNFSKLKNNKSKASSSIKPDISIHINEFNLDKLIQSVASRPGNED